MFCADRNEAEVAVSSDWSLSPEEERRQSAAAEGLRDRLGRRGEKTTLFVSLSGRQPCAQPVTCPGTGRLLLSPETVQLYPLFTGKGPGSKGPAVSSQEGASDRHCRTGCPCRQGNRTGLSQGISCLAGQTGFRVQKVPLNGRRKETLPGDNVPEQAFRKEGRSRSPEAREQDTSCTTILGAGPMYFGNRALGPEGQEETGKPGASPTCRLTRPDLSPWSERDCPYSAVGRLM